MIKISERKTETEGQGESVLLQQEPRCCATWSKRCSRWTCSPTHCATPMARTSSTISPSPPSIARCLTGPTSPASTVSTHMVHTRCISSGKGAESGMLRCVEVQRVQENINDLTVRNIDREVQVYYYLYFFVKFYRQYTDTDEYNSTLRTFNCPYHALHIML